MEQTKSITIGAAYNPDHWPRERWAQDIQLVKEAGLKVLRVADLAWSFLEPEEGKFDFSWLDEFIDMVAKEDIQVILSTPLEASPVWLRHKHPDVVRTDRFGRIHGARGMHCHNNTAFIFYSNRIAKKMASHFADNPAVIGWQIDNELRNVDCYCDECALEFRKWLKDRYGSLEKLNEAWGTSFWSQVYNDWEEVTLPTADQLTISVSQKLDFTRFGSDATVDHVNRQADIIRSYVPSHHFLTHNMMGWYTRIDTYKLSEKLDFISWDAYPHVDGDNNIECFIHDHYRAIKHKGHWVMEQKNGFFNYSDYNLAIEPGLVRLWAYQDIARGADGVMFYRFRSNKYSWEQNPNGLLKHDGTPRRAYYEAQQLTKELEKFGTDLITTTVDAPVAIIFDYHQMWAFEAHEQYRNFGHRQHLLTYHRELVRMGITADLVSPTTDLSKYKVVIAPSMAMVSEEIQENFQNFARNGGTLVIGARSGMKTWSNTTIDTPWPGLLSEMAGVEVDEFEVLPNKYSNSVTYNGKDYSVKVWLDMLETKTAETLATYNEKFYAGRTAIAKNKYGDGVVYYVGVMGSNELARDLLTDIVQENNIAHSPLPDGIFVSTRSDKDNSYTFYINVNREPTTVDLQEQGTDVIQGKEVSGKVTIDGLDLLIVQSEAKQ